MKIKIPLSIIVSDLILPYIARNVKKLAIIAAAIFIATFITFYFIDKSHKKNEALLVQYLTAASELTENNHASALKKFEAVYNSSNGLLEVLALMQIVDITIHEEQYKVLPKLLEEILSIKLNASQSLVAYSKAVTVLEVLNGKNVITNEVYAKFVQTLTGKLQKLKVPQTLVPNKNALLIALGGDVNESDSAKTKNAKSSEESTEKSNELSSAIELMR